MTSTMYIKTNVNVICRLDLLQVFSYLTYASPYSGNLTYHPPAMTPLPPNRPFDYPCWSTVVNRQGRITGQGTLSNTYLKKMGM